MCIVVLSFEQIDAHRSDEVIGEDMNSYHFQVLFAESLSADLNLYSIMIFLFLCFNTLNCYFLVDILLDLYYFAIDFIINLHILLGIILPFRIFHGCYYHWFLNRKYL